MRDARPAGEGTRRVPGASASPGGGDIVVRRAGWLARVVRESCPRWLQEVLVVAGRRLAGGLATHYTGGGCICRLGQAWVVLEGVSDHHAAIDFAAEVRRFKRPNCEQHHQA